MPMNVPSAMPMTFRRLTPDDADAFARLRAEMIVAEPYAFIGSPGDDAYTDPGFVRASIHSDTQAVFGAFDGAVLVAAAGIFRETTVKRRHVATVWSVYTRAPHRARGLSRQLILACLEHARAWPGVDTVQLSVAETQPNARRLYESLGFTAWGTEPHGTRVDGKSIVEIHMWRPLAGGPTAGDPPSPPRPPR